LRERGVRLVFESAAVMTTAKSSCSWSLTAPASP
jgi:hypothetical protein